MPDITMCAGFNCPKRENCYRFTATPNPYHQSYFSDAPWTGTTCPEFWDNSDMKGVKDVEDDLE